MAAFLQELFGRSIDENGVLGDVLLDDTTASDGGAGEEDSTPLPPDLLALAEQGWVPAFDAESGQWLVGDQTDDAGDGEAVTLATDLWSPYVGPRGGKGWKNSITGDVIYGDKPGDKAPEEYETIAAQRRQAATAPTQARYYSPESRQKVTAILDDFFPGAAPRPEEAGSLIGVVPGGSVWAADTGNGLSLTFSHPAVQSCSRTLRQTVDGQLLMSNNSFFLKKAHRGLGIGMEVFSNEVRQCAALGVDAITTMAGRGGIMNGYYTWPRFGYNAHLESGFRAAIKRRAVALLGKPAVDAKTGQTVREALAPAEAQQQAEQLAKAETVLDLMATPAGLEVWKKHGYMTAMRFDLAKGSRSLQVLNDYLATKGKPPVEVPPEAEELRQRRRAKLAQRSPSEENGNEQRRVLERPYRARLQAANVPFEGGVENAARGLLSYFEDSRRNNGLPPDPLAVYEETLRVATHNAIVGRHIRRMTTLDHPDYVATRQHWEAKAVQEGLDPALVRNVALRFTSEDPDPVSAISKSYKEALAFLAALPPERPERSLSAVTLATNAANPARFTGEKRDRLGRRNCYADGRRVKCAGPTKPAPKAKHTVDTMHATIEAARQEGLTPEKVAAMGEHLQHLKVSELNELKRRLGVSASGPKVELARKIAARALAKRGEAVPQKTVARQARPPAPGAGLATPPADPGEVLTAQDREMMPNVSHAPADPQTMKEILGEEVRGFYAPNPTGGITGGKDALWTIAVKGDGGHVAAQLRAHGWDVVTTDWMNDQVSAYPLEEREKPKVAYHLVPRKHLGKVLKQGLLPGSANRSVKRISQTHAIGKVFLSDSLDGMNKWKSEFGEDLVPVQVNLSQVDTKAYVDKAAVNVDPGSLYLIGASIPANALKVME